MAKIQYEQSKTIEFEDNVLAWVDESTNLMWEVKNKDNIDFMYVWHTNKAGNVPIGKNQKYETDIKDATSYVARFNENQYAGFNDWRLPTLEELTSLIDRKEINIFIKKPLQNNTSPAYWTSTPNLIVDVYKSRSLDRDFRATAHIPQVRIVDFIKDDDSPLGYKPENSLWVRCVRSDDTKEKTQRVKIIYGIGPVDIPLSGDIIIDCFGHYISE